MSIPRRKFGRYEDLIVCGITRGEWQAHKRLSAAAKSDLPSPAPSSQPPQTA